jgi:hypothetical protein
MKKRIIVIGLALALSLALVGGGAAYAFNGYYTAGHKLIGVGHAGAMTGAMGEPQQWDTVFIITNPNDDDWLTLEHMAIIDETELIVYEETLEFDLSPHQIWQVSLVDYWDDWIPGKYTLEISWSGPSYSLWGGWCYDRPLIGWAKEFCYYESVGTLSGGTLSGTIAGGTLSGTLGGNLSGTLDGDLGGWLTADMNGFLYGNLSGDFDGSYAGTDGAGILGGTFSGGLSAGTFTGTTTGGTFGGTISNGAFDGSISSGTFTGTTSSTTFDGTLSGELVIILLTISETPMEVFPVQPAWWKVY